jgi:GntR family transcriptional regulator, transcriptional repressor for pyruvate dehydrogenase complex
MHRIIEGTYPCGLRLPSEQALGAELACGRSTVREALRYLADLGLIRSRRGSGAMVLDFKRTGTPALLPAYIRAGRFDASPATIAREMLHLRTLMASEAARLAACHAPKPALAEARQRLAAAPALEKDPAAHALNELELYRALVIASGMWPAAWMVNAFWEPLREINTLFAPAMGPVPPEFQKTMTKVLDHIEQRNAKAAVRLIEQWFTQVDAVLVGIIEAALSAQPAAARAS